MSLNTKEGLAEQYPFAADTILKLSDAGKWFESRGNAAKTVSQVAHMLRRRTKLRALVCQVSTSSTRPAKYDDFCDVFGAPSWEGCLSDSIRMETVAKAGIRECTVEAHAHKGSHKVSPVPEERGRVDVREDGACAQPVLPGGLGGGEIRQRNTQNRKASRDGVVLELPS
jgi:hypothetical protein